MVSLNTPFTNGSAKQKKNGASDNKVMWNFHKFLINENGELSSSLRSGVDPMDDDIFSFAQGK
jgi:glutathione peroxidase-family protein